MKKVYILGVTLCCFAGVIYIAHGPLQLRAADPEVEAQRISEEAKKEYAELAKDNQEAFNIFEDIKLISALAVQAAELLPKEVTLFPDDPSRKTTITVKDRVIPIILSFYNIAEGGLAIIKYKEKLEKPLWLNTKCLLFTDKELKDAVKNPPAATPTFNIGQCAALGCPSKRACLANFLRRGIEAIRPIFDNAVAKYDKKTGLAQTGLLLNIEVVANDILKFILRTSFVKKQLEAKGWNAKVDSLMQNIDTMRDIVTYAASAFSALLEGLQLMTVAIGGREALKYLPQDLKDEGERVIKENMQRPIISDAAIDDLMGDTLTSNDTTDLEKQLGL